MKIPLIYLKDKQAFTKKDGIMKFIGKPIDIARNLQEQGYRLIHIVDEDALSGLSNNFDIYDSLTCFINIQVECAPRLPLIKKLLSVRARVVLEPGKADLSSINEKNLLVAKIKGKTEASLEDFHDLVLEDEQAIKEYSKSGKRIILYEKGKAWGVIISSF
ncbi:hypothetical protein JXA56_05670 [Candidatus Micrarchaeota archaeon]|nr:hypothetical protein [Candidatus Micrarchaeota archaeon]